MESTGGKNMEDFRETISISFRVPRARGPLAERAYRVTVSVVERLLAITRLRSLYRSIQACSNEVPFADKALEMLNCFYELDEADLENIPKEGSCVLTANHPFGGIDGLILISVLSKIRRDFRILANNMLWSVSELRPFLIPVDPFSGNERRKMNVSPMLQAVKWVREGGLLGVFPAGEVAHLHVSKRSIQDPAWSSSVARLVHLSRSPVVPAYFSGRNSNIFQIAGLIHPRLRTAMLPRELMKNRKRSPILRIGKLIPYRKMASMHDPDELINYLRFRSYILALGIVSGSSRRNSAKTKPSLITNSLPFRSSNEEIAQELRNLPAKNMLVESGGMTVYLAESALIPRSINEIGRLREISFRAAGEGTGKDLDLDRFDESYLHLILFNDERKEIVGGYRLGPTDVLVARYGVKGLYTSTLFHYTKAFVERIGPALELGRSFVRPEYQKSPCALFLLWKGIGRFIALNPHYRTLFGPVSISDSYLSCSKHLIARFLELNCSFHQLSNEVRPRHPFGGKRLKQLDTEISRLSSKDLEEVSSWVSDMEKDRKGLPILLKHYIKLGGKILSLSIDPSFHNVIDGLIIVDLSSAESKVLERYMGTEAYMRYKTYQQEAHQRLRTAA
jgi:putative hemolysin